MQSPDQNPQTQERLIGDLRMVIENAEELLKNTDQYTGTHYTTARAKLAAALASATDELARIEEMHLVRMLAATLAANERHGDDSGEARLLRAFR